MKFITHNDNKIDAFGTAFQGSILATFDELVNIFGEPITKECEESILTNDDKVQCEWVLQFDDGQVATIYAWKMMLYEYCDEWNIGGKSKECYYIVDDIIQNYKRGVE